MERPGARTPDRWWKVDRRQGDHGSRHAPPRSSRPAALPLVGREPEMRRIAAAFDRAAKGRGGAIFLAGEAGIGKTRLAGEALRLAAARGFQVFEGRAYPLHARPAYPPPPHSF